MLSGLPLTVQAAVFDGAFFDAVSPLNDGRGAPEIDIGRREWVVAPT
jgi:hypothetical protein